MTSKTDHRRHCPIPPLVYSSETPDKRLVTLHGRSRSSWAFLLSCFEWCHLRLSRLDGGIKNAAPMELPCMQRDRDLFPRYSPKFRTQCCLLRLPRISLDQYTYRHQIQPSRSVMLGTLYSGTWTSQSGMLDCYVLPC